MCERCDASKAAQKPAPPLSPKVSIATDKPYVVMHNGRPVYASDSYIKARGVAEYLSQHYE
jgi:membrane-bound lytic murein transglycosylase